MNPLTPYLIYAKLAIFAVLLAFLGFFAYKVHSWRQDSISLGAARLELEQAKASYAASQKASEGYQNELEEIRNRPVSVTPARLCVPRPAVSRPPSGPGASVPPAGVVPSGDGADYSVGPDIAPRLRELARKADEVSAQGRATQSLHLPAK